MTTPEIQDGLPIWAPERPPKARTKFPVEGMRVGQWFFLEGRDAKRVSAYVSKITKNLPGTWRCRRAWMKRVKGKWTRCAEIDKGAVEGTVVWRIE